MFTLFNKWALLAVVANPVITKLKKCILPFLFFVYKKKYVNMKYKYTQGTYLKFDTEITLGMQVTC